MTIKECGPWVNRLGILLTFVAGFLVAPELLGVARLKKWHVAVLQKAERLSKENKSRLGASSELDARPSILRNAIFELMIYPPLAVLFLAGMICSEWWRWAWCVSFLVFIIACFTVSRFRDWEILLGVNDSPLLQKWSKNYRPLFVAISALNFLSFGGMIVGFQMGLIGGKYLIGSVLAVNLSADGRLRDALVPIGIVFFILGNFLQLLATFF